jgi:hypothetical protein
VGYFALDLSLHGLVHDRQAQDAFRATMLAADLQ